MVEKTTNTMYGLLLKLRAGGMIVSAEQCSADQIATARQFGNVWSDGEGLAYVYLSAVPVDRRSSVGFGSGTAKR